MKGEYIGGDGGVGVGPLRGPVTPLGLVGPLSGPITPLSGVDPRVFEPLTSAMRMQRSSQLSYGPNISV